MTAKKIIQERPIQNVVDIVGEFVDSIRSTGHIDSGNEDSGTYEIVSTNNLSENESIVIDDVSYFATNVTTSSFSITAETGLDFSGKEWKSEWPYYEHGHIMEVNNTLTKRGGSFNGRLKRFPMVILVEDIETTIPSGVIEFEPKVTLLLATETSKEYKSAERYAKSFDQKLTPIYRKLVEAIILSRKTNTTFKHLPHDVIYRPYYGKTNGIMGTITNMFNDPVDVIEMRNIELKIYKNHC